MITELHESNEFYVVLITVLILIAVTYYLQNWWTNYR